MPRGICSSCRAAATCGPAPSPPTPCWENPALVEQLHRDFAHAGSDVIEALPYYGHREKLRVIGRKKADRPNIYVTECLR